MRDHTGKHFVHWVPDGFVLIFEDDGTVTISREFTDNLGNKLKYMDYNKFPEECPGTYHSGVYYLPFYMLTPVGKEPITISQVCSFLGDGKLFV